MLVEQILNGEWGYSLEKIENRVLVKGYIERKQVKLTKWKYQEQLWPRKRWKSISIIFKREMHDISSEFIVNYDETYLVDNPGGKKIWWKQRHLNQNESLISQKPQRGWKMNRKDAVMEEILQVGSTNSFLKNGFLQLHLLFYRNNRLQG